MNLSPRVNDFLHLLGYHVSSTRGIFAHRRSLLIDSFEIDLVIDVGANAGQYGEEIRRYGYRGQIRSFEPLSLPYSKLQTRASRDGNWTAVRGALGDTHSTVEINISENSQSSSLLPILHSLVQAAPESRYVATEIVPLRRLDEEWEHIKPQPDNVLLKLDTQGYEAMVLRGASGVLSNIKLIECELSLVPLYEGQLLFRQMLDIFDQFKFELIDLAPVFFDRNSRHCLQIDGLFAKRAQPQ